MQLRDSWRIFRRMQDSVLAVGLLVYAAAAVDAWRALPLANSAKFALTLGFPGAYLAASLAVSLAVPAARKAISRHLLASYRTGFGQSVISVISGLGLLIAVAGLVVFQAHGVAHGGTSPAGAFSGYGAGLGLLAAQVVLVRILERDPAIRQEISA